MTSATKLKFGWMTGSDENTLLKTMELVNQSFPDGIINTTEVGVRKGESSRAIYQFFTDKSRICFHSGIDNERDVKDGSPFPQCNFIVGNSMDVYNQIADDSQCFIFVDACHSFAMTMLDFLLYSNKLRIGGFIAMHDTAPHIAVLTDYQGHGSKGDADMYIRCRKALKRLGLYDNKFPGFELVFDECDPHALTGGVTVFKRIS